MSFTLRIDAKVDEISEGLAQRDNLIMLATIAMHRLQMRNLFLSAIEDELSSARQRHKSASETCAELERAAAKQSAILSLRYDLAKAERDCAQAEFSFLQSRLLYLKAKQGWLSEILPQLISKMKEGCGKLSDFLEIAFVHPQDLSTSEHHSQQYRAAYRSNRLGLHRQRIAIQKRLAEIQQELGDRKYQREQRRIAKNRFAFPPSFLAVNYSQIEIPPEPTPPEAPPAGCLQITMGDDDIITVDYTPLAPPKYD